MAALPDLLFLPVEVKSRELLSKTLLAQLAAERGFEVFIGRKGEINALVPHMRPGVYYGLGTVANFAPFYADVAACGHSVVVSDEEGLVTFSDRMYLDLKVSPETLRSVDRLFAWGRENVRVLSDGRPESAAKVRATGHPRFDLLKAPYRRIYDAEIAEIRAAYRRYVLMCTSFASCNHHIRGLDYLQSLIDKKVLTSDRDIEMYGRYQRTKAAAFQAFRRAVPLLAASFPEVQFVIRPHPSENGDVYRDAADSQSNVHVDSRFSIHPWLLAADATVHHYCTSAVEAYAAGTPGFALRPERDAGVEKEIPYACSVSCESPEQLVNRMRPVLEEPARGTGSRTTLAGSYVDYVANIGDQVASSAIVDEICQVVQSRVGRGTTIPPAQRRVRRSFTATFRAGAARFSPDHTARKQYLAHKCDAVTPDEIRRCLAGLAGDSQRFECTHVETNVVRVRAAHAR
jgi:surface carbohydrate biosynthesis protein